MFLTKTIFTGHSFTAIIIKANYSSLLFNSGCMCWQTHEVSLYNHYLKALPAIHIISDNSNTLSAVYGANSIHCKKPLVAPAYQLMTS